MSGARVVFVVALLSSSAFAQTDDDVKARIEQVATAADAIVIDGASNDWAAIPMLPDSPVDSRGGAERDIVAVAIAPRADDLLILIETDGMPSAIPNEFVVNLDMMGSPDVDFMIGIGADGKSTVSIHEERDPNEYRRLPEAEAAIGEVVEARVPYAALRPVLPLEMRRQFAGANARTWVRATPAAWDSRKRRYVDFGPAIASYRLTPMADLDSPLARPVQTRLVIPPPFRGRWIVSQGAFGEHTHQEEWSYDFEMVDERLNAAPGGASPNNEDHYSWDQPVIAPAYAGVIRMRDNEEDLPPYRDPDEATPVNGVYLKLNDDSSLWLGHFQKDSVPVRSGDVVSRGAELGRVGNSGQSNRPHLHITAYQLPTGVRTKPIALSNVVVSLNPVNDDPWARRLSEWDVREGLFVEGF